MRVARAIVLRALCALALAVTPVVANVPASRTYACTATCASTTPTTATACGIGNATNTWCGATTAYTYEGCTAERCDDVCGNDASVTANPVTAPVSVSKYGSTFDCFNASHKMQMNAARATQQSVAMNCGPAYHAMHGSYMAGAASHTACNNWDNTVAAAPSAAARGTPTTLAATLAATLATLATLAAA